MQSNQGENKAFTLIELLVVIAIIGILAAMLLPALNKARIKGYTAQDISNLKQWGTAIQMYCDDWNGTYYFKAGGDAWDDVAAGYASPYLPYLSSDLAHKNERLRTMRIDPFTRRGLSHDQVLVSGIHSYSMSVPTARYGGSNLYRDLGASATSPFLDSSGNVWPSLKSVPYPTEYVILMNGGTGLTCSKLVSVATSTTGSDKVRPLDRRGGYVNCLFGDGHVAGMTLPQLTEADLNCNAGSRQFMMN